MNPEWRTFLEQAGARVADDLDVGFNGAAQDPAIPVPGGFLTDLSQLSVLEITGNDAPEFLNNQFISDIKQLPGNSLHYSAWCNPQGRVIAVFIIYQVEQSFYLLLPAGLKHRFMKRLQLYVLRSNVVIRDRSAELVRFGIISSDRIDHLPAVPQASGRTAHTGELTLLRIDAGPPLRVLVTGPVSAMKNLWQSLAIQFPGAGSGLWRYQDIHAGIPWILEPTCELFLPQELNLDITGGLSYLKGCFPGQEVIARIHYRGTVKQRLHRSFVAADVQQPAPGDKLYAAGSDTGAGTIINVAGDGRGGYGILAVADLDSAAAGDLHMAGKSGMSMHFEAVASE
jgi:hypothetical protein